jgi:UDP-N-acetyl-D-mannosaminuronate dehydrogenase
LIAGAIARIGSLNGKRVGVLGLTFKADIDDMRDSLAIKLCGLLVRENPKHLMLNDPFVSLNYGGAMVADPISLCRDCDVVFIATPHRQYVNLADSILRATHQRALIVDVWGTMGRGLAYIQ